MKRSIRCTDRTSLLRCVVLNELNSAVKGSAQFGPVLEMKPARSYYFRGSFHGKEHSILLHHRECLNFEEWQRHGQRRAVVAAIARCCSRCILRALRYLHIPKYCGLRCTRGFQPTGSSRTPINHGGRHLQEQDLLIECLSALMPQNMYGLKVPRYVSTNQSCGR